MFGIIWSLMTAIFLPNMVFNQGWPLLNIIFLIIIISNILISFALKPFFNIDQVGR